MSGDQALARQAWLACARWSRGRRASEAVTRAAFDAWWASFQPSAQWVPEDAPSWWYGNGLPFGHRLYDRCGPAEHPALDTLSLDGGYAPQYGEEKRRLGQFKRTVVASNGDIFTILSWWNQEQDGTHKRSSCFIVRGDHAYSSEALITAFPLHFPGQAQQLAGAGVQLVEAP